MERFCIFCGKRPENKTKEHIIPRWLIEYTGEPNRNINVGFDSKKKKLRSFAFNKLTFPACEVCNREFGKLELSVKSIIISILEKNEFDSKDSSILLDWLDKVRIGLWLLFYSLDDNPLNIGPNFHILDRMAKWDRMVIVYKIPGSFKKGVNFIGIDTFAFQISPSCFTLRINNYYFFNISKDFLFSRRIGFPYPTNREYVSEDSDIISMNLNSGIRRIMLPLIRGSNFVKGIEVYQPMFGIIKDRDINLYKDEYVLKNSLDWNNGIGKVFVNNREKNTLETDVNINTNKFEIESDLVTDFNTLIAIQTYEYQNKIIKIEDISYKNISDEVKKIYKEKTKAALLYNDSMIKLMKEEMKSR